MNVTCPDCSSVFRVDPAKVPELGVRARCSVCGGVIDVARGVATTHAPVRELVSVAAPAHADAPATDVASSATSSAQAPITSPAGSSGPPEATPAREATRSTVDGVESAPRQAAEAPTPPPTTEDAPPDGRPARPFNPYLSNTPELRARRLARALVSDLVAYNPQKREEGLRDGTLRQLFREEIRKSWEEYVEQVGAHVAESTPHFQDALNDVLAGGRRVF